MLNLCIFVERNVHLDKCDTISAGNILSHGYTTTWNLPFSQKNLNSFSIKKSPKYTQCLPTFKPANGLRQSSSSRQLSLLILLYTTAHSGLVVDIPKDHVIGPNNTLCDIAVDIVALTFDRFANLAATEILGCNFQDLDNLITTFPHPECRNKKIAILFDACHMLKLVTNMFRVKKSFI